jgi:small subunit ribosomal protein S8e
MPAVPEDQQLQPQAQAQSQASAQQGGQQQQAASQAQAKPQTVEESGMQPFEWIGPDETSMSGPVTYAKAQRGEIAPRPGNPNQALKTADGGGGSNDMMDQDGLKLRIELNLDIEVELKARIQGDLTLALL